jgi:hypothetical protein
MKALEIVTGFHHTPGRRERRRGRRAIRHPRRTRIGLASSDRKATSIAVSIALR